MFTPGGREWGAFTENSVPAPCPKPWQIHGIVELDRPRRAAVWKAYSGWNRPLAVAAGYHLAALFGGQVGAENGLVAHATHFLNKTSESLNFQIAFREEIFNSSANHQKQEHV